MTRVDVLNREINKLNNMIRGRAILSLQIEIADCDLEGMAEEEFEKMVTRLNKSAVAVYQTLKKDVNHISTEMVHDHDRRTQIWKVHYHLKSKTVTDEGGQFIHFGE